MTRTGRLLRSCDSATSSARAASRALSFAFLAAAARSWVTIVGFLHGLGMVLGLRAGRRIDPGRRRAVAAAGTNGKTLLWKV